ncbi:class I SAM-dependent rRNA methyltransferase [Limisphaera sp. VF-2]|jgi:23S rRNA (cytosine1962-C5)-methyltransferase|uniref:class I SAM-dependent rRNA methyltransferase n=1 Tax=Limisphaera sp. VF-2 TaxID=3400418 RepID=UPI001770286B
MRKHATTQKAREVRDPTTPASLPDRQTAEPEASVIEPTPAVGGTPEAERIRPWVQLKYISYSTQLYPAMIAKASPDAQPGSLVTVYDKAGRWFGTGLYNPHARVPLRMLQHGPQPFTEEDFVRLLDRAVELRVEVLRLPEVTDAFRVVHSDGDGLSGLIVDKLADVLSIEVHSLGIWQRLPQWLPHLHRRLGTRHAVVEVSELARRVERIPAPESPIDLAPRRVRIREHGVLYEVDFAEGHKTGFFCDQRDNRVRLARLLRPGQRVLDLCCYTGGFALAAAVLGKAGDVTGVDLDEKAIARARRNANLNQVRVQWVHCDAFSYARQMQRNGRQWDVVVVDPPKFVPSREEREEGRRRYEDLNGLAAALVAPGGLLVTCSCSGLVTAEDFEQWVCRAVHRLNRRLQILDRTGAGPDHPVMSNCPEGRYLKVIWARVW